MTSPSPEPEPDTAKPRRSRGKKSLEAREADAAWAGFNLYDLVECFSRDRNDVMVVRVLGYPTRKTMRLELLRTGRRNLERRGDHGLNVITLDMPLRVKPSGLLIARDSKAHSWSFFHENERFYLDTQSKEDLTANPASWKSLEYWDHSPEE